MLKIIKDLWQIAKKDLIEFTRDKLRLVTFFVMPMFMMIMVGFIFPNQNSLKNIPIGISQNQDDQTGQKLVEAVESLEISENTKAFALKNYADEETIKEGIKKQEITGGLVIPADLSEKIAKNEQVEIIIVEDQSNPQISQMINVVLVKVVEGFNQGISEQKLNQILVKTQPNVDNEQSYLQSLLNPIKAKIAGIIAGNPNYFEFVAPGIIAMIVMTAVLTGLAAAISREKEQGTLDGILISPINRLSIILGKALAQSIRGLIQGAIVMILAIIFFGVTIHGNILLIILILFLGVFSFVGLGILVSALATEQETATQLLFMFQFPMLFLSGVFFPILMMPSFMQSISKIIPLTYAITALRKVMVLGAGIPDIKNEIIILLIFGIVTLSVSVPVFKKVTTR